MTDRKGIGLILTAFPCLVLWLLFGGLGVVNAASPTNYDIVIVGGRVMDPETGLDKTGMNVGPDNRRCYDGADYWQG